MDKLPTWAGAEMIRAEDEGGFDARDAEIARLNLRIARLRGFLQEILDAASDGYCEDIDKIALQALRGDPDA